MMSKERKLLRLLRRVKVLLECSNVEPLQRHSDLIVGEIKELLAQPEQTEQEPVATKLQSHQFTAFHVSADDFKKLQKLPTGTKIYTAPPKREPLSDEAIAKLWGESYSGTTQRVRNFARAIEQQHGIGGGK